MTDPRCFYCSRPTGKCNCEQQMLSFVEEDDKEFKKLYKDIINDIKKGVLYGDD